MIIRTTTVAIALTGALALTACSPQDVKPPDPVTVYVVEALAAYEVQSRTFTGTLQPRVESTLGFRVGGQLLQRRVEVGSTVRQGDVLAVLDDADYRLALAAARAQKRAAEVDARQTLEDAERLERLASDETVGRADAERQRTGADAAQARLAQSSQQVMAEENRLAYTRMTAPFDGVVTGVRADVGQVLDVGAPVITLARVGALDVVVDIPETWVDRVRRSDTIVRLSDSPGTPAIVGVLREVAAVASSPSRTFRVRYTLDGAPPEWRLGRTATVVLTERPDRPPATTNGLVSLPLTALVNDGRSTHVWSVDEASGRPSPTAVVVHRQTQDRVWVTGVVAGTRVVALGAHKVDGSIPVRPVLQPASPSAPGASS